MEQSTVLINNYDVDIQAFVEPGINWSQPNSSETFSSFFNAEVELHSVMSHNKNEDPPTLHQQGITVILGVKEIPKYWRNPSSNWRGLGWWTSICPEGNSEHKTQLTLAYYLG